MTIKKRSSLNYGCQDVPHLNIFITLQIKKLCTDDGAGAVIPAGSKLGSGAGAEKAQYSWAWLFATHLIPCLGDAKLKKKIIIQRNKKFPPNNFQTIHSTSTNPPLPDVGNCEKILRWKITKLSQYKMAQTVLSKLRSNILKVTNKIDRILTISYRIYCNYQFTRIVHRNDFFHCLDLKISRLVCSCHRD